VISLDSALQLEALADKIEAATAPSSSLNSSLLKLVREPALAIQGIKVASSAASYTSHIETALKLRPQGYRVSFQELQFPPPFAVVSFERMSPIASERLVGAGGKGATLELALCAAIARTWAMIVRNNLPA